MHYYFFIYVAKHTFKWNPWKYMHPSLDRVTIKRRWKKIWDERGKGKWILKWYPHKQNRKAISNFQIDLKPNSSHENTSTILQYQGVVWKPFAKGTKYRVQNLFASQTTLKVRETMGDVRGKGVQHQRIHVNEISIHWTKLTESTTLCKL